MRTDLLSKRINRKTTSHMLRPFFDDELEALHYDLLLSKKYRRKTNACYPIGLGGHGVGYISVAIRTWKIYCVPSPLTHRSYTILHWQSPGFSLGFSPNKGPHPLF